MRLAEEAGLRSTAVLLTLTPPLPPRASLRQLATVAVRKGWCRLVQVGAARASVYCTVRSSWYPGMILLSMYCCTSAKYVPAGSIVGR